jgi:magnesium-transporting ATPase (P-type)
LTEHDSTRLRHKYGPCELRVPRKGILRLLVDEVLNPFYIFQVFSMVLWFNDGYEKYAACILVISLMGVGENLYETVTNIDSVRKMAAYECQVKVKREDGFKEVGSSALVPGDVIIVPEDKVMPCDLVMLSGSCIVNESMLTGESVPVIKNCLTTTRDWYDPNVPDKSKKHTLYSGTKAIQTRSTDGSPVVAMVIRTGFVTTKGDLIRNILFPREIKFKFY